MAVHVCARALTWLAKAPRATYPSGCRDAQLRGYHLCAALKKEADNKSDENPNPFWQKYRSKIESARGDVGANKDEATNRPRRAVDTALGKSTAQRTDTGHSPEAHNPRSPLPLLYSDRVQYPYSLPPSLDNVMIVDRIMDKSVEEISQLWKEYHSKRDCVSAVIPSDVYLQLSTKASLYPLFLYPLPRQDGYEFFYSQILEQRILFTSLTNYQNYKENAPVALTLTHYTELQESKGIVLMKGDVDTSLLKTLEAQFLANQVQLYYTTGDRERFALLKQFNRNPETFDYQDVIGQLQSSSIEPKLEQASS